MPELPEVETMRRGVLPVVGGRIEEVIQPPCDCQPIGIEPKWPQFRQQARGRTISAVERIGKRVALKLEDEQTMIFEPRMTGLVLLADPPSLNYLRLELRLSGVSAKRLLYWDRRGLGNVRLLSPQQLEEALGPHQLGPDALQISEEQLRLHLKSSRREIKPALLDQKAVAGVGNIYACEILHRARVHPQKRCDRMARSQWERIHRAMQEILREAISHEGSTLSDGTYRNALNDPGGYQNHHRVYDRQGETCRSCEEGEIQRIVQNQRATFFCSICQTKKP